MPVSSLPPLLSLPPMIMGHIWCASSFSISIVETQAFFWSHHTCYLSACVNSDLKSYFLVARGFQLWRLATVAYQKVGHLGLAPETRKKTSVKCQAVFSFPCCWYQGATQFLCRICWGSCWEFYGWWVDGSAWRYVHHFIHMHLLPPWPKNM